MAPAPTTGKPEQSSGEGKPGGLLGSGGATSRVGEAETICAKRNFGLPYTIRRPVLSVSAEPGRACGFSFSTDGLRWISPACTRTAVRKAIACAADAVAMRQRRENLLQLPEVHFLALLRGREKVP